MDVRFRPPRKNNDKQWAKIEYLIQYGFFFQKVYLKKGSKWQRVKYPETFEEAKQFVVQFSDQTIKIEKNEN